MCIRDSLRGEYVVQIGPPEEIFCRELICKLYDLSNGSYNPLFGSFEMERSPGEAAVFVIAGGGTGIPAYRALHKSGIPFATGILHENDVDYQLARDLANEVVSAPAFERIGKEAYARALQRMKACGTVLCLSLIHISRQAEKPSSSGIITSMMMMSNASLRQTSTASIPSCASLTSCPSNTAYFLIMVRIFSSSSTTRILYMSSLRHNSVLF